MAILNNFHERILTFFNIDSSTNEEKTDYLSQLPSEIFREIVQHLQIDSQAKLSVVNRRSYQHFDDLEKKCIFSLSFKLFNHIKKLTSKKIHRSRLIQTYLISEINISDKTFQLKISFRKSQKLLSDDNKITHITYESQNLSETEKKALNATTAYVNNLLKEKSIKWMYFNVSTPSVTYVDRIHDPSIRLR